MGCFGLVKELSRTTGQYPINLITLGRVLCRIVKQLECSKGYMWLGGGEVDLKLGFHVADFIRAYKPLVLDCTA